MTLFTTIGLMGCNVTAAGSLQRRARADNLLHRDIGWFLSHTMTGVIRAAARWTKYFWN